MAQKGGFEPLCKNNKSIVALCVLFFRLQIRLQNFCKLLVDGVSVVIFHRPDCVEIYSFQHVVGLVPHSLLRIGVWDTDGHSNGGRGVAEIVETVVWQAQFSAQAREAHIDRSP